MCIHVFIDSGFGCILDVFVNTSTAFAASVFVVEQRVRREGGARRYVRFTAVAIGFRIYRHPGNGQTSQDPFSHLAVL